MPLLHRRTITLPASDIDAANRVMVGALFRAMQDAAASNAEEIGVGYTQLDPLGLFWVLSWVTLAVDRYPGMESAITLETWPKRIHHLYALRDFTIDDAHGPVARATTAWLLVDRRSRRIRPPDALPWPIPGIPARAALDDVPDKPALDGAWTPVLEHRIRYSDLDVNGHTNNTRYIDRLCDCFPLDWHRRHDIAALTVRYQSETREGDSLLLHRREGDAVAIKGTTGGALVFHARITTRLRAVG